MRREIKMAEIHLTPGEIDAAVAVLRSGELRQGPQCQAFEKAFADFVGARHAVAVANGSAALHMAYHEILSPGDEVLVPTFTFIATASMAALAGGRPVFCDVDPGTYLMDLEDARKRLTPRTRVIAPVHLFGNAVLEEPIRSFAEEHGLQVVWDAAQAHGARHLGRDIGAYSGYTCYSFYPSKNMFVGEGGMICTDDPERAESLKLLRSHGQSGKYFHSRLGFNYRMTDVEAAIGLRQLERLPAMLDVRRRNAAFLNEGLSTIPGIDPQVPTPGSEHAWHLYCVRVDPEKFGCGRDELAKQLGERGIASGVHYPRGLHEQPAFAGEDGGSRPVAEGLSRTILAIPIHHGLEKEDLEAILEAIRAASAA